MANDESEVNALIHVLKKMKSNKSNLLSSISDFDLLIQGLIELDDMIEMEEIKMSIVAQIKFLLINVVSSDVNKNFDGHMVHTVLLGPSGVGKTSVGTILAKIWTGLGLLKNKHVDNADHDSSNPQDKTIKQMEKTSKMKNEIIKRLQNYISSIKTELKDVEKQIKLTNYKLKSFKREVEKRLIATNIIDEIINSNTDIKGKVSDIIETVITDEHVSFISPVQPSQQITNAELEKEIDNLIESMNTRPSSDFIKIVSREDLVGGYLGQTAIKTEKLLRENFGKVIFIDEAYSLVNDERDSFGREALTVLNRYMSEYSDSLIIIFAGYKDLMDETIFKEQPGLKRRCSWIFEIKEYSTKGLAQIFKFQVEQNGWKLEDNIDLVMFFNKNKKEFPNYGGSTLQLTFHCKLAYSTAVFDEDYPNEKIINQVILEKALNTLKSNKISKEEENMSHIYL